MYKSVVEVLGGEVILVCVTGALVSYFVVCTGRFVGIVLNAVSVTRSLCECDVGRYVVEMPGFVFSNLIVDEDWPVKCVGFSNLIVVDCWPIICVGLSILMVVDGWPVKYVGLSTLIVGVGLAVNCVGFSILIVDDGFPVNCVLGCLVPMLAAVRFANFDGYTVDG